MTAPYTAAELAEISARAEKATPGPWEQRKVYNWVIYEKGGGAIGETYGNPREAVAGRPAQRNATFIAAARADVPRLVAELTQAKKECALLAELNDNLLVLVEEGDRREFKLEAELTRAREALTLIAAHAGKTLMGDGRYDEGANAAFEAMADIARAALGEEPADG